MRPSVQLWRVCEVGLFLAAAAGLACGDSDAPAGEPPGDDAGADVFDASAASDADSGCSSCAWFPEQCSPGALCAVNVATPAQTTLLALDARDGVVTAVGTRGSVIERTSDTWRLGGVGTSDALRAISIHGDDVWAAGSLGAVFIRSTGDGGGVWTQHREGGPGHFGGNRAVNGLVVDARGAWAALTPTCAGGFSGESVALVRVRREPAWLAVEKIIEHRDFVPGCVGLNALDLSNDVLWAAGDLGVVYKLTNLESAIPTISPQTSGTASTLLAVWAENTGHVWAAGKDGAVLHRPPDRAFAPEDVPAVAYHAVRGTSPSDVWIAGADATVMHFDGVSWKRVPIAGLGTRRPTLRAIATTSPDRVWVAGDGVLLALAGADGKVP